MAYWHIQMMYPKGPDGPRIDSSLMLKEETPLIGTGEWDDYQCVDFKDTNGNGVKLGDIMLVREGNKPLALCEITGNSFKDKDLTDKFLNKNFRTVRILDWYNGNGKFPKSMGTLEYLRSNQTQSWKFIDNWYKRFKADSNMQDLKELLEYKKQIILQGPPGTGKTFTAKDIAEKMIFGTVTANKGDQKIKLEESDQFKIIQFHPAYTYEDFVRGITAKATDMGLVYKSENKLLGNFAKKALNNFLDSKKSTDVLSYDHWVIQEMFGFADKIQEELNTNGPIKVSDNVEIIGVDEDNAFRYSGPAWANIRGLRMKFSDIVEGYKGKAEERKEYIILPTISRSASQHATYYFAMLEKFKDYLNTRPPFQNTTDIDNREKSFVLIIDEINRANLPAVLGELIYALEYRGDSVESMYELEDEGNGLILPDNLYIIGTMNTADRSVGHIDYAIRRRFAFKSILPSSKVIEEVVQDPLKQKAVNLYKAVKALFSDGNLASDFKASDVQLGHSYFLAPTEDKLKLKLDYEIKPLLSEYLKDGILLERTIIDKPDKSGKFTTEEYISDLKIK